MAKKFLNGWSAPHFRVVGPGVYELIYLKLRYQAFTEYVEETYIEHQLLDGSIKEKFLYANYFWELDYSALAESEELIKIKKLLNYIQKGCSVELFPHTEIPRSFFVTSTKDRLSLGRHYGGIISPGEKDFSIMFKTRIPVSAAGSAINWIDLNDNSVPINVNDVFNQHHYLTDELDNILSDESGFPVIFSAY